MPLRFLRWVQEAVSERFQWPSSSRFNNAFKYLYEQYTDNVKTNLRTHCKKRLKKFFTFRAYTLNYLQQQNPNPMIFDEDDIKNAVNYTYNNHDSTNNDVGRRAKLDIFLDELRLFGAPADCNIRRFVDENWFQSLRMWINIQRDVEHFHKVFENLRRDWYLFRKYPQYVTRPAHPEPPRIDNFAAVPLCSSQRRHIRIDTDVLYGLLCEIAAVPKKIGKRKGKINIKQRVFFKPIRQLVSVF